MDYLEIYNTNFDQALKFGNAIAKESLVALKNEKRASNTAHNSTYQLLTNHIKENNISKYESLINLERFFKQTLSKYEENHIELALKNEITEFYKKRIKDELPENYSFLLMVEDLANFEGLNEIARLFYNQSTLYDMMYQLNDFSQFTIQSYGNIHYEDTPLFNELRKRLYPNIINELPVDNNETIDTLTLLNNDSPYNLPIITNNDIKSKNENYREFQEKIDVLNEKDKGFLFHIIHISIDKKKNKYPNTEDIILPLTELVRLNAIINSNDLKSFDKEKYREHIYYEIANEGIYHFKSDKRIHFLKELISKISDLQLTKTSKFINHIINNQYNKI